VLFQLKPPAAGLSAWTPAILHTFTGYPSDGRGPNSVVISSRQIFATTSFSGSSACTSSTIVGCGTAFSLAPPVHGSAVWNETLLWSFTSGADGWIPVYSLLPVGTALYGISEGGGIFGGYGGVFQITP
jgi:hypothetical protein